MKTKIFLLLIVPSLLMGSCSSEHEDDEIDVHYDKPINSESADQTVDTSLSIDDLCAILDFSEYKPVSVEYRQTQVQISMSSKIGLSFPVRPVQQLEVCLHFDALTFRNLQIIERKIEWKDPRFKQGHFAFDWLSDELKAALENSHTDYHGHPDFHFQAGANAQLWYVQSMKVVLLRIVGDTLLDKI